MAILDVLVGLGFHLVWLGVLQHCQLWQCCMWIDITCCQILGVLYILCCRSGAQFCAAYAGNALQCAQLCMAVSQLQQDKSRLEHQLAVLEAKVPLKRMAWFASLLCCL
jgi:hypothetical protein